jgi:SAM-dependent methyltransferase
MERIPEPELMNETEQALAYASADFSEPHQAFVAHFRRCFPGFSGDAVLDLGCGPADVTIRFACAYPAVRIVGVDGAEAMLALGRQAVARAGLADRIRLRRVRLPDPVIGESRYAAIISNSLLHHLGDPRVLWQTVAASGAPGMAVFVMDLMRPQCRESALRLLQLHAADAPEVLRRDFHNSLLAAYRPDEVRLQLADAGLSYLQVEVVSDRHLLVHGTV